MNASTVGSVGGGWLSGKFISSGWSLNASRKTAMLICALCVVPVFYAPYAKNMWVVIGIFSLAARHPFPGLVPLDASDLVGAAAGAAGNALMLKFAGLVVTWTGSYFILFMISGSAYLVALGIFQLLSPRLEQAKLD